jgi:hypothetical protein
MDSFPPLPFKWNGAAFVPLSAHRADHYLKPGEKYILVEHHERSSASHGHEFAWLTEAWMSLSERDQERWQTSESLRKWALIKSGFAHSHTIVCASKAEARRVAAFIKPIDEHAVVTIVGTVVTRYTAMSQSKRAMGAKIFQESKTKIMEVVSEILGIEPGQLPTERAA